MRHKVMVTLFAALVSFGGAVLAEDGGDVPLECTADTLGGGGGCVNVNEATAEQLATLYRIGPALAGRIVAEREEGGPFSAMHEVAERVSGVGGRTVCFNQRAIIFAGPTTRIEKYAPEERVLEVCRASASPADECVDC